MNHTCGPYIEILSLLNSKGYHGLDKYNLQMDLAKLEIDEMDIEKHLMTLRTMNLIEFKAKFDEARNIYISGDIRITDLGKALIS